MFQTSIYLAGVVSSHNYAVSEDGKRFLITTIDGAEAESPPITVVLNWTAALKR